MAQESTPPALANNGMWTPEQLRPLLECSVLPIRSVELLHQIEQAGEQTGAGVYCPVRQMEEAHARSPNFSGTRSAVGIWAACRTACTSLGNAQKAATTSRVRRRSHDGLRWGARNWLMGL